MKKRNLLGVVPVLVFLVIWEIGSRSHLFAREIFPPFSDVIRTLLNLLQDGVLIENFTKSFIRVIVGFTLGSVVGILVGVIIGWNKYVNSVFSPIISIFYPIPALGWLPILMLCIGINEILPITIIFICSFFPVCYNTSHGIRSVDTHYIYAARLLGASPWRILVKVVFPLALGNIFTGIRLEAGMAWRVVIAAEMIAIPKGIGALMGRGWLRPLPYPLCPKTTPRIKRFTRVLNSGTIIT